MRQDSSGELFHFIVRIQSEKLEIKAVAKLLPDFISYLGGIAIATHLGFYFFTVLFTRTLFMNQILGRLFLVKNRSKRTAEDSPDFVAKTKSLKSEEKL